MKFKKTAKSKIRIRKANILDFRKMDRILDGKSWFEYSISGKRYDIPQWYGRNFLKFLRDLITKEIYFLEEDGKVVGIISFSGNDLLKGGIYVMKKYRGKGYGSKLLRFAEKEISKKYDSCIITVGKNNVSGYKFFRKNSYKIASYVVKKNLKMIKRKKK